MMKVMSVREVCIRISSSSLLSFISFSPFHSLITVRYAFTMADFKFLGGVGPRPINNYQRVPFVVSEQKGKLLYYSNDEGAEYPQKQFTIINHILYSNYF